MITIETPNSKRFKILISPKVLKITEIKKKIVFNDILEDDQGGIFQIRGK